MVQANKYEQYRARGKNWSIFAIELKLWSKNMGINTEAVEAPAGNTITGNFPINNKEMALKKVLKERTGATASNKIEQLCTNIHLTLMHKIC